MIRVTVGLVVEDAGGEEEGMQHEDFSLPDLLEGMVNEIVRKVVVKTQKGVVTLSRLASDLAIRCPLSQQRVLSSSRLLMCSRLASISSLQILAFTTQYLVFVIRSCAPGFLSLILLSCSM